MAAEVGVKGRKEDRIEIPPNQLAKTNILSGENFSNFGFFCKIYH